MLIAGFPAGAFQTNCFVVAAAAGEPCVVVDPGQDAVEPLAELLAEHRLNPVAVLLTHGHFDHTFSVAPVCDGHDIPAWIHPDDRDLLADPLKGLSADAAAFFGGRLEMREPREVRPLDDGAVLDLAGLRLTVDHTPGHTPGSVIFSGTTGEGAELILAGDTLFAGSIGRTDLPGGDHRLMLASLRDKLLTRDDATLVLPGHGPTTTIGRERGSNPFLRDLAPSADPDLTVRRGL
ncbi:MAG: hydroxyacylglutathione hydrolase [Pseudonocardiales bacterium]|nr:hydroxyacylglutathione hydrolase [Pseudonocardiales bacterium]MDT7636317.1 hydroxyacylglutathione hydrolase [Pseudonocardiales bacterium]MDT7659158.1 hydroxyacylglutathione hydrolase [Pseudonocardiales bacterium]MDT7746756.1 hydroxyacylglutathione hydrolase [Pseudonocardiales bacterium]